MQSAVLLFSPVSVEVERDRVFRRIYIGSIDDIKAINVLKKDIYILSMRAQRGVALKHIRACAKEAGVPAALYHHQHPGTIILSDMHTHLALV